MIPVCTKIITIPDVAELDCINAVKSAPEIYAIKGLESWLKIVLTYGSVLNGSRVFVSRVSEKSMNPKKNIGLLKILNFLPKIPNRNPTIISIEAKGIELSSARCAVTVVPILLPNIIGRLLSNEIIPVLTKVITITVTAVLDCITAVVPAPRKVAMILFFTSLPSTLLNLFEANCCNWLLRFSIE